MSTKIWLPDLDSMLLAVEVAFGADLTDIDGSGWTWTDITEDLRVTPGITTRLGRGDEAARSQPANMTVTLDNESGDYSLGGLSRRYPYIRRGTPVRVRVNPDDGSGYRVLFQGFADGWSPVWEAAGQIPTVRLSASGTLRRLGQGRAPLPSPYRRSTNALSTVRAYWPMEEVRGAQFAAADVGEFPLTPTIPGSVEWASSSDFESSAPLPDIGDSGFVGQVPTYTATGESMVRFMVIVPEAGLADGTVLAYVYTTGTIHRWDIVYSDSGTGNLSLFIYNQAGGTLNSSTTNVTFDMDGNRRRLCLSLVQDGADIDWTLEVLDANPGDPGGSFNGTVTSRTFGIVNQVFLAPGNGVSQDASGTIMGHLEVHDDVTSTFADAAAFWAWQRRLGSTSALEFPSSSTTGASRMHRLCEENGIDLVRYTGVSASDTLASNEGMGPQTIATLLDLLQECETADQGQIWDGRGPGLTLTTRRFREDGVTALTLDASAGELSLPFDAVDDDQRTRNRAVVSRTAGVTSFYEDTTGPMGTQTIGTYETSLEVNSAADSMVLQHAAFQVSLGTVYGYRYPVVTVDLLALPALAGDVLDLIPGSRVQITNADTALAEFSTPTIDLLVEGIHHSINASGWICTLICSPASPWLAAQVSAETGDTNEMVFRLESDGSTLNGNAARTATSISVVTASGPLWTTTADDYPLTLDVGGIQVVATACSGSSSPQTFTIQPLEADRSSGAVVKLWNQRPLGL